MLPSVFAKEDINHNIYDTQRRKLLRVSLVDGSMPDPQILLPALADVLRNFAYGFGECNRPTNKELTLLRRRNMMEACRQFLDHAVGPGDLWDARTRAEFSEEAYRAYGSSNKSEGTIRYCTQSPFRDVARKIVQDQSSLNKEYYESVVQRVKEYCISKNMDKTVDDCNAMLMELTILAAGCDGVRTVCDSLKILPIAFPTVSDQSQPAPVSYTHLTLPTKA